MHAALMAIVLLAAAGEPAAPAPTPAREPPPPANLAASAEAQQAKPGDKLICKTEQITGTLFTKKVCRTPAEIEELRKNGREQTSDIQTRGDMFPGLPKF